jgi:outer membrane protein assembly factor BamB
MFMRTTSVCNCRLAKALILLGLTLSAAYAKEPRWPQFRGPAGLGIADDEKPPTYFGAESNVVWQVELAPGASSPCIWGNRIFLTTFTDGKLATVCVDRLSGRVLWQRNAPAEKIEPFHPTEGSPASATPVADGDRVIVYFGSCGLLAYDFEGKELWRLSMPVPQQVGDFGSGTSPVRAGELVLLNRDQVMGSELLAVEAATGKLRWKANRPEFKSSFGTPALWSDGKNQEVVLPGSLQLVSYDLATGTERWRVHGVPSAACTTPVVSDGMLFFAGWSPGKSDMPMPDWSAMVAEQDKDHDGMISLEEANPIVKTLMSTLDANHDQHLSKEEWEGFVAALAKGDNVAFALRPGGHGDISDTHVAWKYKRGLPYVPSPLVYHGSMYFVRDGGMVTCLKAATGEPIYEQERLEAPGSYYSSPVAANGVIYTCSMSGTVSVFRAGDKLEVLARNEFKERIPATPAIVENTLYLRTAKHLYAFRSRP